MILKYIAKGIVKGLDEWADSLTQEQFNTRMTYLMFGIAMVMIAIFQTMEYNTIMEIQGGK